MLPDALVSDLAAGVLQQQGENYFQRGQAYVQSKMGFLSSSNLQYHFNIDKTYGVYLARFLLASYWCILAGIKCRWHVDWGLLGDLKCIDDCSKKEKAEKKDAIQRTKASKEIA